jgi:hypothetical protein
MFITLVTKVIINIPVSVLTNKVASVLLFTTDTLVPFLSLVTKVTGAAWLVWLSERARNVSLCEHSISY